MEEVGSPYSKIAKELGARLVERRISWIWAMGFPTLESASTFATMLYNEGKEVRGPHEFGDEARGIAVGWKG
jgi:hypothetical protein